MYKRYFQNFIMITNKFENLNSSKLWELKLKKSGKYKR